MFSIIRFPSGCSDSCIEAADTETSRGIPKGKGQMKYRISAIIMAAVSCLEALAGGPMRVAFVGDPQVDNAVEMGYARRSIYKELSGRKDIDLCVFLGDLVNDDMALLPESVSIIDSLPFPCFMIPGNHDRDVYRGPKAQPKAAQDAPVNTPEVNAGRDGTRPRDLTTWRRTVGYIDTAFFRGNVHFILMNNVRQASAGMTDYTGGFTDKQKHWLDSVFRALPEPDRASTRRPALTILATHIPVSQMKGRDSLMAMIPNPSRMLFISGHTHYVSRSHINIDPNDSIPELVAGASCGSWWRGVKDGAGVPYALQSCGAPRGYFTADIRRDGRYRLSYKCIGRPASEHLSVWALPETPPEDGQAGTEPSPTGPFRIYVNVFGGSQDGKADISAPGKCRRTMRQIHPEKSGHVFCRRSSAPAPEVEEVVRFNASMPRDYRKAHRDEFIPLRLKPSTHLWESPLLTGQIPSRVNVRYRDSHMRIRSAAVTVKMLDGNLQDDGRGFGKKH